MEAARCAALLGCSYPSRPRAVPFDCPAYDLQLQTISWATTTSATPHLQSAAAAPVKGRMGFGSSLCSDQPSRDEFQVKTDVRKFEITPLQDLREMDRRKSVGGVMRRGRHCALFARGAGGWPPGGGTEAPKAAAAAADGCCGRARRPVGAQHSSAARCHSAAEQSSQQTHRHPPGARNTPSNPSPHPTLVALPLLSPAHLTSSPPHRTLLGFTSHHQQQLAKQQRHKGMGVAG